jgi:hypothetical protein
MDGVVEDLTEEVVDQPDPESPSGDHPTLPVAGVLEKTESSGSMDRKDSKNSKDSKDDEEHADLGELPFRPPFKPTTAKNFRNWETSMRKRELQRQSPQPEDLQREYRFWELKMRKGELDSLLLKSKQTWLLDKVAELPESMHLGTARTFWEVKTTGLTSNEKRCFSMPVRERPPSVGPSSMLPSSVRGDPSYRLSLRDGFEKCVRPDEDILQGVFSLYFDGVDEDCLENQNVGRTLMVHDLRNKFSIEDVLGIFDELGAEHVDYVFLPLSVWETKKSKIREPRKTRNKAYCFVHFSDVAASEAFVDRLNRYELPKEARSDGADIREKQMNASLAASQGVVPNLLRLMDIHNRKWHPRAGALALRLGDTLVPVNVPALRKLLLDVLKDDPKKAPGCLRKRII